MRGIIATYKSPRDRLVSLTPGAGKPMSIQNKQPLQDSYSVLILRVR